MPGAVLTLHAYHEESRRLRCAVLTTVPLLAAYEVGLALFSAGDVRNAADVLIKVQLGLFGRAGVLVLNTALLVLFLCFALRPRSPHAPRGVIPLMLLESAAYAALLAPAIFVFEDAIRLDAGPHGGDALLGAVLGVGAGIYEELLFRLVLLAGGYALLRRLLHVDPIWAAVVALLVSSLAFSAFHHCFGALSEPWNARVFVFRFLAGLLLGALFLLRGFGIAAWTHALYDVFLAFA